MTQLRSLAFSVNGGLEASSVARRAALASLDKDGGWWLVLFDRIADRWGITSRASGTCVWFELRSEPWSHRPQAAGPPEQHPSIGVLVLSQYVELGLAMRLLADSAEGVGYLLKDRISDVREFVAAVEKYVSSIFGKLGLPSTGSESRRVLAVLLFLRSWLRVPPRRPASPSRPGGWADE